ncbi:hypothetical protein PPYR_10759 [Photinus pyralis]|uniref:CUB domain-containing protein n=1 Tax=Photinus pyralis TaxID=7054 RepID=A0A1Y1LBX5_PHOPY|nr:uncharacterized protein LOC116174028 [Photinus pyralis]KAB0796698.1 hypothetical protein PPYR_10759 [Photinus pyralis]
MVHRQQILYLIIISVAIARCDNYGNTTRNKYLMHLSRNSRRANQNWYQNLLSDKLTDRQSRFLNLFTVMNIDNLACVGVTGERGTCLTQKECQKRGGKPNGGCAGGFAYCCVFLVTCGATVRENGTYFVNQGFPQNYDGTGSCQITLVKSSPKICQYRVDFDKFVLAGPENVNNICNNDQFMVSGASNVPPICGKNSDNHMYIDSGEGNTAPIILSVVTSGPSFMRTWKMRISQIPCTSRNRGEMGCLQYYNGVSGQIKSFNYDLATGLQLSNQDYSICIRAERNFCSIQYTACPDTVNNRSQSFTLAGISTNVVQAMTSTCQADFIIIPMAQNVGRPAGTTAITADRFCGGTLSTETNAMLSSTLRSNVKPFRIWFHTDNVESPTDIGNRGFCLDYVQQPCSNIAT